MESESESGVFDVIIVGAGWGGLQMLRHLLSASFNVRCLERDNLLGGTWNWNRYPGARVDHPSNYYTVQEPELWDKWKGWTEKYASWQEILDHANWYADQYGLRDHITFNVDITECDFSEATHQWTVATGSGTKYQARFVIMATGSLSDANIPNFAKGFEGIVAHTGRYPKEGIDYTGKRVAVVGTGSSGVQSIPEIAKVASHVTVFQRTAQYVVPLRNEPREQTKQIPNPYAMASMILRKFPFATNSAPRWETYAQIVALGKEKFTDELERRWQQGGLEILGPCLDLLFNKDAEKHMSEFLHNKIASIVKDPEVAKKLTPKYGYVCKRFLLGTDYFETFNLPNVTLHSLEDSAIQSATKDGLVTADGKEHKIDILLFATGYDALRGSLCRINIRNAQGESLKAKYESKGVSTYLGIQSAGFPNLFFLASAQSPSVLTNMLWATDQHARYFARFLIWMRENGKVRVEASVQGEEEWCDHCNAIAAQTLLTANDCKSWYLGSNIEGKPRQFLAYAGGIQAYEGKLESVAAFNYAGFDFLPAVTRQPIRHLPCPAPSGRAKDIIDLCGFLPKTNAVVFHQMYPVIRAVWDGVINMFTPALGNTDLRLEEVACDAGRFTVFWVFKKGTNLEEESKKRTIIYFHGGAYLAGGIVMYRNALDYLVRDLDSPVMFVEYGLVPENTHAKLLAQCATAYDYVLSLGVDANSIAFVGDSAGGGITLQVVQSVRDAGKAQPAAVACLSPWLDATLSGESYQTMAAVDVILNPQSFNTQVSGFVVNWSKPLDDPSISPLFGSFKNLPPLFFVVGASEILLSDSTRAYGKSISAGLRTKLEIVPYMFHDFVLFGDMPEAFNARQAIRTFLEDSGF